MSKIESYKDLKIWQQGITIAKQSYLITKSFPEDEKFGLISQIRRSAVSIPSNIAEGFGRGFSKHFVNFLKIAKGSLFELETQLFLSMELGYVSAEVYTEINLLINDEGKMINALINKLNENQMVSKEKVNH